MDSSAGCSNQRTSAHIEELVSPPIGNHTRTCELQPRIEDPGLSFPVATSPTSQPPVPAKVNARKRKLAENDNGPQDVSRKRGSPVSPLSQRRVTNASQADAEKVFEETKARPNNAGKAEQHAVPEVGEKRLIPFRNNPPQTFIQRLHRATHQRMIVIDRVRGDAEELLQEDITIVGSTGNIYTVRIAQIPSCTCPDHAKGNECKHKIYALHTVLKAPHHLQYQRAFLSSELRDIFAKAPPIPTATESSGDLDGNRKPVEGECPICYMDFGEEGHNPVVWCKAACGNNMHKTCFEQWAASQRGQTVKCVYCRTPWAVEAGNLTELIEQRRDEDGYINVADHFGMSMDRDYSTYHQPWVRRQFSRKRRGW